MNRAIEFLSQVLDREEDTAPSQPPVQVGDDLDEDEEDDEVIDRVAGRAALKLEGQGVSEYFLVYYKDYGDEAIEWLPKREFDTPLRRRMVAEYKSRTGGETDPEGKGWVRKLHESKEVGRGRQRRTEYKVEWLMDPEVPKLDRLFDWVVRSQLLSPDAVLGPAAAAQGGSAALPTLPEEEDSDASDGDDDNYVDGDGLVWDASSQRFRISISRTLRFLKGAEPSWLMDALEEWCAWRLYALDCLVPRESSVTASDLTQLGDDLYEIDRDGLDALNTDGVDPAQHEQEQKGMMLQRIDLAWRKRRQRRERDSDVIRGQMRGLRLLKARRANPGAAADTQSAQNQSQSLTSQQDDQMRRDADRIVAAAEAGQAWWTEFAKPSLRMHAQSTRPSFSANGRARCWHPLQANPCKPYVYCVNN